MVAFFNVYFPYSFNLISLILVFFRDLIEFDLAIPISF
jgi:hypothetical protein